MGSATQRSKRMGLGEMPVGPEEQFYQPSGEITFQVLSSRVKRGNKWVVQFIFVGICLYCLPLLFAS